MLEKKENIPKKSGRLRGWCSNLIQPDWCAAVNIKETEMKWIHCWIEQRMKLKCWITQTWTFVLWVLVKWWLYIPVELRAPQRLNQTWDLKTEISRVKVRRNQLLSFTASSRSAAAVEQTKDGAALILHAVSVWGIHFRLPIKTSPGHLHTVAAEAHSNPGEHLHLVLTAAPCSHQRRGAGSAWSLKSAGTSICFKIVKSVHTGPITWTR